MNDFFAAVAFMANYPQATGKVGITGFCNGGGVSNAAAVAIPELACAVPFYGRQPPLKEVDKIKAPLLLHYAGLDSGINEGWPAYEQALKEHHKVYEAYFYQGVNHGFHNDSTPRYDRAAADLAWQRTLHGLRSIYASATVINSATARSKKRYIIYYIMIGRARWKIILAKA
ncbi:Carboxymethylenebutenolidase [Serratia liquefaciens]|nr:Carboxymethylenebutenolidase [Serratia liquefaciens]